jgi:hypothetical protein
VLRPANPLDLRRYHQWQVENQATVVAVWLRPILASVYAVTRGDGRVSRKMYARIRNPASAAAEITAIRLWEGWRIEVTGIAVVARETELDRPDSISRFSRLRSICGRIEPSGDRRSSCDAAACSALYHVSRNKIRVAAWDVR